MRRLTAFIITALMLVAVLLPVSADLGGADLYHSQGASESGGNTNFKYTVAEGYQLSIPESIDLTAVSAGDYATGLANVSVSDIYLPRAKTLTVTLKSANGFKLIKNSGAADEVNYKISKTEGGSAISNPAAVLSYVGGTSPNSASQNLYFLATNLPSYAGEFRDALTFSVSASTN